MEPHTSSPFQVQPYPSVPSSILIPSSPSASQLATQLPSPPSACASRPAHTPHHTSGPHAAPRLHHSPALRSHLVTVVAAQLSRLVRRRHASAHSLPPRRLLEREMAKSRGPAAESSRQRHAQAPPAAGRRLAADPEGRRERKGVRPLPPVRPLLYLPVPSAAAPLPPVRPPLLLYLLSASVAAAAPPLPPLSTPLPRIGYTYPY